MSDILEWMNKGDVCKRIPGHLVEHYKKKGWVIGKKVEKPKPTYSKSSTPSTKKKEEINE